MSKEEDPESSRCLRKRCMYTNSKYSWMQGATSFAFQIEIGHGETPLGRYLYPPRINIYKPWKFICIRINISNAEHHILFDTLTIEENIYMYIRKSQQSENNVDTSGNIDQSLSREESEIIQVVQIPVAVEYLQCYAHGKKITHGEILLRFSIPAADLTEYNNHRAYICIPVTKFVKFEGRTQLQCVSIARLISNDFIVDASTFDDDDDNPANKLDQCIVQ